MLLILSVARSATKPVTAVTRIFSAAIHVRQKALAKVTRIATKPSARIQIIERSIRGDVPTMDPYVAATDEKHEPLNDGGMAPPKAIEPMPEVRRLRSIACRNAISLEKWEAAETCFVFTSSAFRISRSAARR